MQHGRVYVRVYASMYIVTYTTYTWVSRFAGRGTRRKQADVGYIPMGRRLKNLAHILTHTH